MSPSIVVRPFADADRAAVIELAPRLSIGVAPWRDSHAVARAVRGWLEAADADHAFVAEVDGRVAGFISVATTRHFAGELDAEIGELVVDERTEGLGVGTKLVAAVEGWASSAGHRCITLSTGASNDHALRFYRHLGFQDEDIKLTRVLPHPSRLSSTTSTTLSDLGPGADSTRPAVS